MSSRQLLLEADRGENSYAFWRREFNNYILNNGENIRGVGYRDQVTHDRFKSFILTVLGHSSACRILDVGGGMGLVTSELTEENTVCNLDMSFAQLKSASRRRFVPVQGNAIALPFKDESFDFVVCCGVVQYIKLEDREKFFGELQRVCRGRGLLFLETPNAASVARRLGKALMAIIPAALSGSPGSRKRDPAKYLSLKEMASLAAGCLDCQVYAVMLIYRPLREWTTLSRSLKVGESDLAQMFCTDATFVLRKVEAQHQD